MADGDEEMGEPAPSGDSNDITEDSMQADPASGESAERDGSPENGTAESGTATTAGSGEGPTAEAASDGTISDSVGDTGGEDDADENVATNTVDDSPTAVGAMPDGAQAAAPVVEEGATEDGFEGAPDDEEMPLTEHIEEMIKRLAAVIVVMGGVSLVVFPVAPDLINWLWYSYLPGSPQACATGTSESTACPRVYHPLGLLFSRIKVASLVGFIIALPVFVYQTYLFMRPGLYPHERRYYLAAVPTSLLLAFVGLAFSYFLVLPVIFTYFLFYSEDVAGIAFGLTETFDLILLMMGTFAAIFQIPLFIMLAIMMGVTTRRWLEQKRYYFWLGFAGFAFIFSPDPTGMAPFIVGLTMVALYELTLLLLRWTGR